MVVQNDVKNELSDKILKDANNMLKKARFKNEINILEYFDLKALFETAQEYDLLVGIPSDNATRNNENGINNAELAYIHTYGVDKKSVRARIRQLQKQGYDFKSAREQAQRVYESSYGSPAYKIPPRPIIEPAIEANSDKIQTKVQKSLDAFLNFDFINGEKELKKAGMFAQNKVRAWFTDERNGWPPNAPYTIEKKSKGGNIKDKPLIDTGQLRKAITYVVAIPDNRFRKKTIKSNERQNEVKKRNNEILLNGMQEITKIIKGVK